jgi:hypothetical protein
MLILLFRSETIAEYKPNYDKQKIMRKIVTLQMVGPQKRSPFCLRPQEKLSLFPLPRAT